MVSALDVDANKFIKALSEELKKMDIKKPEFVDYVKVSSHNERPPEQKDFWWIRCAAILRHIYKQGSVGTQRLRAHFGGSVNRGRKPYAFRRAGGSIIRKALQELEKAGLIEKDENRGRKLTPKGMKLLSNVAKKI